MPRPIDFLLRVTAGTEVLREGTMIFADVDSLVMFDRKHMERVTVRPDSGTMLELYQGQRRSGDATARGAARGAVIGAAVGLGEALLTVGLTKLLGGNPDLESTAKGGIITGAVSGSLAGGIKAAEEGEPVWERVTLLRIRQQLCKCPDPDRTVPVGPVKPLIP
ncbi:MAG TPA: hypothetical protein VF187_00545 [Gemmatimonadales bacterium]